MIRPHAPRAVPRLMRASDATEQGSKLAVLTLEVALRAVPVIGQTSGSYCRGRRFAGAQLSQGILQKFRRRTSPLSASMYSTAQFRGSRYSSTSQ